MLPELMSPTELANLRGITTGALANERSAGKGPKYVKLGKHVFYRKADVGDWINANVRQSTSEALAA